MPTVDRVITRAWRALPESVRSYAPFTGETRGPALRVRRTLLRPLLQNLPDGYSFSVGHWNKRLDVSDHLAAAIASRIREAAPRLESAVAWHQVLRREYEVWVRARGSAAASSPSEWLMAPSLALAIRHGSPGPDAEAHAREEIEAKASGPAAPTAADVQRHIRRHRVALQRALDAIWVDGFPASESVPREPLDAFHSAAFAAQRERWAADDPARTAAVHAWHDILDLAAGNRVTLVDALTSSPPPERPALEGGERTKETAALDRSIADRLSRVFQGSGQVVVQPLDAAGPTDAPDFSEFTSAEMVELMIGASASALGLADPAARAVVLIADRMTGHLAWQADETARTSLLARYPNPADGYFLRRWFDVGWTYRSVALPGSTLGRLLESPAVLFLARAWTRAARTQFEQAEWRVDARMAWEHATGAFRSVVSDAPSLYHYAQQVDRPRGGPALPAAEAEDDESRIQAVPDDAFDRRSEVAIERVIAVGTDSDGPGAVTDFRFQTLEDEPPARATWERWANAAARADGGNLDDYPTYDQMRQHRLRSRAREAAGQPPPATIDDVLAITEFVQAKRGTRPEQVSDLLRRACEQPPPPRDGADAAAWDSWCAEYAADSRGRGEEPRVPTYAEATALIRRVAGL